jgi:hypothetical protein
MEKVSTAAVVLDVLNDILGEGTAIASMPAIMCDCSADCRAGSGSCSVYGEAKT